MIRIPILQAGIDEKFPPVDEALAEPDGLLAAGGDLSSRRLLEAYRHGIFPWFSRGDPILWWSPDPRTVFTTGHVHIPTRMRRWLRQCDWRIRADQDFASVMRACAAPRPTQPTTWITPEMHAAYLRLHELGHAHCVEVRAGERLVGGIYGVAVGKMFFGESMFGGETNGSKVALIALCRTLHSWGFPLLDAQVSSTHLTSLGAWEMRRKEFVEHVTALTDCAGRVGSWSGYWTLEDAAALA